MMTKKLEVEVLLMVDWWNRTYHEEFERSWNMLKKIYKKKKRNSSA